MTWKIITVITVVLLAGTILIAWQNHQQIGQQNKILHRQRDTLDFRTQELLEATEQIASKKRSVEDLELQIETLHTEKVDVDNRLVVAQSDLTVLKTKLEKLQNNIDENKLVDFEGIRLLQRQIADVHKKNELLEIDVVKKEGIFAVSEVENANLIDAHSNLKQLRDNQEQGIITGGFQSSIIAAYQRWGFAVIEGGNREGVVPNAQLDAYRNGQLVAKLLVTQVDSHRSIADIVPGSGSKGIALQVGDLVVQNANTKE